MTRHAATEGDALHRGLLIHVGEALHRRDELGDDRVDRGFNDCREAGRKQRVVPIGEVALVSLRHYVDSVRAEFLRASGGARLRRAKPIAGGSEPCQGCELDRRGRSTV